MSDLTEADLDKYRSVIRELTLAAEGKKCNEREMALWVSRNIVCSMDQIDVDGVPDRAAIGLLVVSRGDPGTFYEKIWPRTFSRSQLDSEDGRVDEGREVLRTIGIVEAASKKAMSGE